MRIIRTDIDLENAISPAGLQFEMSRYKGQLRASRTEQEFPHHVDIIVPPGGLGTRLDAMYEFHAQHGIKPQRGQGKQDSNGSVIRWCFADGSLAAVFASKFKA
ncbi:MAG TPA: hypothetical protein VL198_16310 [Pseudolabrys sp.]|nr:hypothetical protein [Pseudolabrys sp.]